MGDTLREADVTMSDDDVAMSWSSTVNGKPASRDLVERWQGFMRGARGGGWIGYSSAHAVFDVQGWPEGSYWDFDTGAYYVPL